MGLLTRLRLADSRPPTGEFGESAMLDTYTSAGTKKRLREQEYLYELAGPNRYRVFDRMRFSDPKVAGLRRAQTLPVVRASVAVEPAEGDDPRAKEIADFVEDTLLRRMDLPWRAWLQNALLYQDYGFAPFEIVWRVDDDQKVRVERLAYRPPSSIMDIYVDRGRITSVLQQGASGNALEIPGDKLLWLVNDKEGDNFKGRAILRAMHKPWYSKEKLEIQLLILVEKMGGIPVVTEPAGGLDDATRTKLDTAAANLRIMEQGYLRLPEGVLFDLKTSAASVGDVLEGIRYFDTQLSNVAQAQVLDLGTTVSGNRALGTTFSDMFSASIEAQTSYLEDVLNGPQGLINRLVEYNYANCEEFIPSVRFGKVSSVNMLQMAQAFATLGQAGMEIGPELWEWVRQQLGLPETPEDTISVPPEPEEPVSTPAEPAVPAPTAKQTPEPAAAPTPDGAVASEVLHLGHQIPASTVESRREGTASFLGYRAPRDLELYVELDELAQRFERAKTAIRDETEATRKAMAKEVVKRAVEAADKGSLVDFTTTRAPMMDKLSAQIRGILTDFFDAGRKQVKSELDRQKAGKPVVQDMLDQRRQGVAAAEKGKAKAVTKGLSVNDALEYIDQQSMMLARSIGQGTIAAAASEAARGVVVTLVQSQMESMVMRGSDAAAMAAGPTVTRMMNIGRGAEAKTQKERIGSAYYSAVLDSNVCAACETMDGTHSTNLDEADNWTPNPECDGGDRCRCFTIYEEA